MILQESELIPFKTINIPTGSCLVFAPHPDDETFGMGGTILKLTDNKQIVDVIIMTDGSLGGDKDKRKNEAIRATKLLGVNECYFLNAPDRNLEVNTKYIHKTIELIKKYNPKNIFFTSPLEYHPDHRATAWLVWNAMQTINFTGNCFSYEVGNQSQANLLIDISKQMNKKINIMQEYRSQLNENDYIQKIKAINSSRSYTLEKNVFYAEAFFQFNDIKLDLMAYFYNHYNKLHSGFRTQNLPLVSVLIRTKNRPHLLKKALESLNKQTYQQFEVNIVNDGGCDIQNIVDSFKFERIFIKNHPKSEGSATAANSLLKMVQGEYCIFLDDDDTFDSEHLENLINVISQNQNMLVCYSGIRIGNDLENNPVYNHPYNAALLRRGNYIPIHALLFSKKLIELGCRFDESFEIYEDWDFWLQLAKHTTFHHINKISATYNINGDSGAGESNKEIDERVWALKIYEKHSKTWTPIQISQNFNLTDEQPNLKKDVIISEIKDKLEKSNIQNKHLNNHIDLLLNEQLSALGFHNSLDSDFLLKSARKYESQCKNLFEEVFQQKMSSEFWNWKYSGVKWRGICAIQNDKVIAHYNGMPRQILYFGEYKKALQACDTMVATSARGGIKNNSPFYNVAKAWISMNIGINKDFLLAYGFPNKRVMLLAHKLGLYSEVDEITEIHWEATQLQVNQHITIKKYQQSEKIDAQINNLWRDMAEEFKEDVIGIRNTNYIKKRYLNHPSIEYEIYTLHNNKKDFISLFIIKNQNKDLLLMDIIAKKENYPLVINEVKNIAKDKECKIVKCWITKSKANLFECCNSISNNINVSIPTSAITSNFNPKTIKDKWFLMYGDTDFI